MKLSVKVTFSSTWISTLIKNMVNVTI